jgi:hypothetical protein
MVFFFNSFFELFHLLILLYGLLQPIRLAVCEQPRLRQASKPWILKAFILRFHCIINVCRNQYAEN